MLIKNISIDKKLILFLGVISLTLLVPELTLASVESSLAAIQSKFINKLLPAIAILGLVMAGLSFASGNENARNHFKLALFGAAIGFGAPSIVNLIQSLIN